MKRQNFFLFLQIILFISVTAIAFGQNRPLPEISLLSLDNQDYAVPKKCAKVFFFFDARELKNTNNFKILNKLAYSFRTKRVEILGAYSDFEKVEQSALQKLQEEVTFPIYIDPERLALKKMGISNPPALLIADIQDTIAYSSQDSTVEYETVRNFARLALGIIDREEIKSLASSVSYAVPDSLIPETEKDNKDSTLVKNIPTQPEPQGTKPGEGKPGDGSGNDVRPTTGNNNKTNDIQPGTTKNLAENKTAPNADNPQTSGIPDVSPNTTKQTQEKDTKIVSAASTKTGMDIAPISTISILVSDPVGYKPDSWGFTNNVQRSAFWYFLDILVKLCPLLIWGWGMLYTFSKIFKYKGMLCGFLGCFGFFFLYCVQLVMQAPIEICILFPGFSLFKDEVIYHYQLLSPMHFDLFLVLIFQLGLLKGIAGRFKKEEEAVA